MSDKETPWFMTHGSIGACISNSGLMEARSRSNELAEALCQYDFLRDAVSQSTHCQDGGCLVKRPQGMHTNGGCKCHRDEIASQRMMYAGQRLAEAVRVFLKEAP